MRVDSFGIRLRRMTCRVRAPKLPGHVSVASPQGRSRGACGATVRRAGFSVPAGRRSRRWPRRWQGSASARGRPADLPGEDLLHL